MKFSRTRIFSLTAVFVFAFASVALASPQDQAQVAKNLGEPGIYQTKGPVLPRPSGISTSSTDNSVTPLSRVGVQSAQPISLSLSDAIRRALESNNDIEVSRGDVRFQETRVRSLLGNYDMEFRLVPTLPQNSSTGTQATRDFRINTNLSKLLKQGGGDYTIFFNNQRTESAFSQAQVTSGTLSNGNSALYSGALGVQYNQPLWRNFKTDNLRNQITIARKRLEQTDSDFQLQATSTITGVARAYWDFVFALRNQQNEVANVNLAKENLRQVEAKIAAGASAPLERAEVATELANREGSLLLATQTVASAENALKQLVLKDPLAPEWGQTFVPTDAPAFSLNSTSLDQAMKDAMDNRFELKRLRLQRDINNEDIKYFKNQAKPQIDLNTAFSLAGVARSGMNAGSTTNLITGNADTYLFNGLNSTRTFVGLPVLSNPTVVVPPQAAYLFGNFTQAWSNMFRSDGFNFSLGVTISFPFRNTTAKANLDGARIQQDQILAQTRGQEQAIVVQVRNAVQAVETSRQRVLTARRARESAEIQLDGERKLYDAGKSTTFLLFQRENSLTNARNAEIRAETDYNKAVADLQNVTSTAFRANNITIKSPLDK